MVAIIKTSDPYSDTTGGLHSPEDGRALLAYLKGFDRRQRMERARANAMTRTGSDRLVNQPEASEMSKDLEVDILIGIIKVKFLMAEYGVYESELPFTLNKQITLKDIDNLINFIYGKDRLNKHPEIQEGANIE